MKNRFHLLSVSMILLISVVACKSPREKLVLRIDEGEKKLFNDSTKMLNAEVAVDVLNAYKEYADKFPEDTIAPVYLFKAGELSGGMNKYNEALELYSRLREKYPDHRKAAVSLFLQAFIYDTNLREKEKAKQLYAEFMKQYPDHQLFPSAQASYDQLNMGLSDEDLIKMFEARQDSLAKAGK